MEGVTSQVFLDTQSDVTEDLISERRSGTAVIVNAAEDCRGGTWRATQGAGVSL